MTEWKRVRKDERTLLKIPRIVLKTGMNTEREEETALGMDLIADPIIARINAMTDGIELGTVWKTVAIG